MDVCCADMRHQLTLACDRHADPYECPERLVAHSAEFGIWGLILHDGGRAVVGINFCPWCGAALRS